MFTFLVTLLILVGIITMVVVLLQAGKGGGLAAVGGGAAGTDSFIGGRQAATILTKATWIGGGVFLGLSLILSVLSTRAQQPASILQEEFRQNVPAAPAPILPELQSSPPAESGSSDGAAADDAAAPSADGATEAAPGAAAETTPDN